ncbi:MAG: DUF6599 family protein [bacterium]
MITLRRITQVLSFCFFIALIVLTAYPLAAARWVDFFPRLSPHLFAAVLLNTLSEPGKLLLVFLPALIVLALTPILGRFFCGWLCPMGVTLDVTDRLVRRRRDDSREPAGWKPLKYYILIVVLASAYFEANLYGWLDPLSLAVRSYALVFYPVFDFLARLGFNGLYPAAFLRPALEPVENLFRTAVLSPTPPRAAGIPWLFIVFLGVVLLAFVNRRFWCRFLCPLGAVHALASRRPLYRRVVSGACTECGKCARTCRMGAIGGNGRATFAGECIECFTCRDVCPEGAVSFRFAPRAGGAAKVSLTRRGVLGGIAGTALAVPLVRLSFSDPARGDTFLVRPPGVWDEERFLQECVRCGECMKVCPTNGLQPSWFEAGLEGMWTPRLVSRIGWCEFNCTMCGQVCPTHAVRRLSVPEKHNAVIGIAVFDRDRCIPWAENEDCIVCEEHCPVPVKAIRLRRESVIGDDGREKTVLRPYVVEKECIGCGICENKCPVPGQAAIRVTTVKPRVKEPGLERGGGEKPPGGGDDILRLFPGAGVRPWTPAGEPAVFVGERLYDFIDGAAEKYFEFGFTRAATLEYASGGETATVDVFEMSAPRSARAIFEYENPSVLPRLGAGDDGAASDYQAALRLGRFYVKITYFGSAGAAETLGLFASEVEKNFPRRER